MNIPQETFVFIDIFIGLIFLIFIIKGFKNGLVYELINLGFFVISIIASWIVAPILGGKVAIFDVTKTIDTPFIDLSSINSIINTFIWFVILIVVINFVYMIIKPIFKKFSKIPLLGFANKILGSCINIIYAFLVTLIISMLFTFPVFKNGKDVIDNTVLKYADDVSGVVTKLIIKNIDLSKIDTNNFSIEETRQELLDWLIDKGILDE